MCKEQCVSGLVGMVVKVNQDEVRRGRVAPTAKMSKQDFGRTEQCGQESFVYIFIIYVTLM